jgi:hypothetical protein
MRAAEHDGFRQNSTLYAKKERRRGSTDSIVLKETSGSFGTNLSGEEEEL